VIFTPSGEDVPLYINCEFDTGLKSLKYFPDLFLGSAIPFDKNLHEPLLFIPFENLMTNHTIQPENVKRFVNLNHPDGVMEVFSILPQNTA
jgi:hypothetical protein